MAVQFSQANAAKSTRQAKKGNRAEWRRESVGAAQPAVNSSPTSNSFEASLASQRGSLADECTPEK
jgi:hypothetical protein